MTLIDSIQRDPAFTRVKAMVIGATGLAYYADKDAAFAERIARRLPQFQHSRHQQGEAGPKPTLGDYLERLEEEGPAGSEFQALINELAVGETFFFRYIEQFEALCAVAIPECLRRNQASRLLRIWSAGCSIGPEAYTLEILLRRTFAEQLAGWQVHILGTDINGAFIDQARRATYGDWALRGLAPDIQDAAFDHRAKQWTVKPEFRQWTSFMVFNLVEGPIPSYPRGIGHFDIILCRNVMIYFDEATRRRLLGDLHAALNDGGWLVVGHAEAGPQMNELFSPVPVPGATLYRKQLRPPPRPAVPPPPRPLRVLRPAAPAPAAVPAPAPTVPPVKPPMRKAARRGDEGERGSALEAALAEVERSRMDPVAHYRLGLLEEDLGVGDPVAAFKRALYLDPGFVLADYHLALAYWRRGKLVAAHRHFRNARDAMAGRPDDEPVAEGGGLTVRELHGMVELWLSGEEA